MLWWGYKHINGTYQVKRYYFTRDIEEALLSGFVSAVEYPFEAENRKEALIIIKNKLSNEEGNNEQSGSSSQE